ncbi:MAG TPA: hypothetical protein VL547_23245 [Dinghuibacter sp.]|uniref:hypothetical protein n=1 Tax=Dinghuibacter sp. TaxID=2024697 RepID=UPI002B5A2715|nr:hypothetical protein [Dinghuibacter sp.]HTJ14981.1 hypothetical protein [Dinghuibacter sp.]
MNRLWITIATCFVVRLGMAQNLYTVLHLNESVDYKTRRPRRIVESDKIFHSPDSPDFEKIIKAYDAAGMLTRVEYYNRFGDITARRRLGNDTVRRLILADTTERWTSLGHPEETASYTYDSAGYLTGIVDKDGDDNVIDAYTLTNNDRGNPISMTGYGPAGELLGRQTGDYRYEINRVYVRVFSADGRLLSTDTLKISLRDASLHPGRGEQFNDQGDITHSISIRQNGAVDSYQEEYVYDPYGNCTVERIYRVSQADDGRLRLRLEQEFRRVYVY